MKEFCCDSPDFLAELGQSAHAAGEVEFLGSIAKPGMCAIEIGANHGVTAVAIAASIGSEGWLYAFEPVPEYFDVLERNLCRNHVANASAHRLAVMDRPGRIRFFKHGGGSGIAPTDDAEEIWVEATTISDFLANQPRNGIDLLNMDCEGSELLALRGAEELLREARPQVFCEVHHGTLRQLGHSPEELVAYLQRLGYRVEPLHVERLH
ncbi:MAG: FkbM family methyltransferase, partial [bacterium]